MFLFLISNHLLVSSEYGEIRPSNTIRASFLSDIINVLKQRMETIIVLPINRLIYWSAVSALISTGGTGLKPSPLVNSAFLSLPVSLWHTHTQTNTHTHTHTWFSTPKWEETVRELECNEWLSLQRRSGWQPGLDSRSLCVRRVSSPRWGLKTTWCMTLVGYLFRMRL